MLIALIILIEPTSIPISSSFLPGSSLFLKSSKYCLVLKLAKIASAIFCFLVLPSKFSFNLLNTSLVKFLSLSSAIDVNSILIVIFKDSVEKTIFLGAILTVSSSNGFNNKKYL